MRAFALINDFLIYANIERPCKVYFGRMNDPSFLLTFRSVEPDTAAAYVRFNTPTAAGSHVEVMCVCIRETNTQGRFEREEKTRGEYSSVIESRKTPRVALFLSFHRALSFQQLYHRNTNIFFASFHEFHRLRPIDLVWCHTIPNGEYLIRQGRTSTCRLCGILSVEREDTKQLFEFANSTMLLAEKIIFEDS